MNPLLFTIDDSVQDILSSLEEKSQQGENGGWRVVYNSMVYLVHVASTVWVTLASMISSAERWQIALGITLTLFMTANLWGVAVGMMLSRVFRKSLKKSLGISFRAINFSPFRLSMSLTGVTLRPSDAALIRQYFITVFPSADVMTPAPRVSKEIKKALKRRVRGLHHENTTHSVPFHGSSITIKSLSVNLNLRVFWFHPLSFLGSRVKENEGEMDATSADVEVGLNADNIQRSHHVDGNLADEKTWNDANYISRYGRPGRIWGKLDPRTWLRLIKLCGLAPRITVNVQGLKIEIDKVYLAPKPPEFATTSTSLNVTSNMENMESDISDDIVGRISSPSLPAAVIPSEFDLSDFVSESLRLPTFDQETVLKMLEEDEVCEADTVTFFLERWLERVRRDARSKEKTAQKDGPSSGKNDKSKGDTGFIPLKPAAGDEPFKLPGGISEETPKEREERDDDRINSLLQSIFSSLLFAFKLRATDISLVITGADVDTVTAVREGLPPCLATLNLAAIPRYERAITVISVDMLTASFRDNDSCTAVAVVMGLAIQCGLPDKVHIPIPPSSTDKGLEPGILKADLLLRDKLNFMDQEHEERRTWHEVVPPHDYAVEFSGVLNYLIWATNYDHYWEKRSMFVEVTASEMSVSLAPRPLHTVLLHLDDFIDPNSPYQEWTSWMSVRRLTACALSNEERSLYRQCYLKVRGEKELKERKKKKKQKRISENSQISEVDDMDYVFLGIGGGRNNDRSEQETSSSTPLGSQPTKDTPIKASDQLASLEKRMTRYEIMEERCTAMGKKWEAPSGYGLAEFLRSTQSHVETMSVGGEAGSSEVGDISHDMLFEPHQRRSPFERVYRAHTLALVGFMREKFNVLAPCLSVSVCVDTTHVDIPHVYSNLTLFGVSNKDGGEGYRASEFSPPLAGAKSQGTGGSRGRVEGSKRLSKSSAPSTLTVKGLNFDLTQRSASFSRTVYRRNACSTPKKNPSQNFATNSNLRVLQNMSFTLRSAAWLPKESVKGELALPTFQDGSACGMLYKHPQQNPDFAMLHLNLKNAITPTKSEDVHIEISCECSHVVFVANPIPLLDAIDTLISAATLPIRDIYNEPHKEKASWHKESSTLGSSGSVEKSSSMVFASSDNLLERSDVSYASSPGATEVNGTLLNGIDISADVEAVDVSVFLLTDSLDVEKGSLELSFSGMKISADSSKEFECVKLTMKPLTVCACRLFGTNDDDGGRVELQRHPFKHALHIDDCQLSYSARLTDYDLKASDPMHTPTEDNVHRIEAELNVYTRTVALHSSPTVNMLLLGCIESLKPLLGWDDDQEKRAKAEEMRRQMLLEEEKAHYIRLRRQALSNLWAQIDTNGSQTLDRTEVEGIVQHLFGSLSSEDLSDDVPQALKPTHAELQREMRYFLFLADADGNNELSLEEVEEALFGKENVSHESKNRNPLMHREKKMDRQGSSEDREKNHEQTSDFLTIRSLQGLIYYEDLREYSAVSQVYRIAGVSHRSNFPSPSTWRHGEGIRLFWDIYERETGCSRSSLNGQDIRVVQRKLVRCLLNYEFAKFCWKSLVKPGLDAASAEKETFASSTAPLRASGWLLDSETRVKVKGGTIDLLIQDVADRASRFVTKETKIFFHYDVKFLLEVDSVTLSIGNALPFTEPLFHMESSQLNLCGSTLVQPPSQGSIFVSEPVRTPSQKKKDTTEHDEESSRHESQSSNKLHIEHTFFAQYLNTRQNALETFVEPFLMVCNLSYDSTLKGAGNDTTMTAVSSFSGEVSCPHFFIVNVSPSGFFTFNKLNDMFTQATPESFEKLAQDQEIETLRQVWNSVVATDSMEVNLDVASDIVTTYLLTHWKIKQSIVDSAEVEEFVSSFVAKIDTDNDGLISFSELENSFRSKRFASRSILNSAGRVRVWNKIGQELKFCTRDVLEKYVARKPSASSSELMSLFDTIRSNNFVAVQLDKSAGEQTSLTESMVNRLALFLPNFRIVDDMYISAYQPVMFPLKPIKSSRLRRRGFGRRSRLRKFASGFDPFLTLVPVADNLDGITLNLRSCVTVEAQTPVDIRVVRIPSSSLQLLRGHKRRDGRSPIDLTKRNLLAAVEQACDNAPIAFEQTNVQQGFSVAIPLHILSSSSYHVLLLKDSGDDEVEIWRKPVLLTKEFLHNSDHASQVFRFHASCGITVKRDRLNIHRPVGDQKKAKSGSGFYLTGSVLRRKTAWDTVIQVIPSFVLSNALPFPVRFRCWQEYDDDSDDWSQLDFSEELGVKDTTGEEENLDSEEETLSSLYFSRRRSNIRYHKVQHETRKSGGLISVDRLPKGGEARLHGINMDEVLFLQVSHDFLSSKRDHALSKLVWTPPIRINLNKLRTGAKKSGKLSLPRISGQLGDEADLCVDITVERNGVPYCTLYAPYWVVNKTGMKMEFKFTGRDASTHDSGVGGLPILAQCNVEEKKGIGVAKREVSAIPLETVGEQVRGVWWNSKTNGELVLAHPSLKERGKPLVRWSEKIGLDAVGTVGEISCYGILFGVSIETLIGAFHRSNLIKFSPRYIVKNVISCAVSVVPILGVLDDAMKTARLLENKEARVHYLSDMMVSLQPFQSTILYRFEDVSPYSMSGSKERFVLMRVNGLRQRDGEKWHLAFADNIGSSYYIERDGPLDTIVGMIKIEVQMAGPSTVMHVRNVQRPPYKIENRSNTHFLQFVQDDPHGVVKEIPPMSFCFYSWDNPFGKRRLRFAVIEEHKTLQYLMEQARNRDTVSDEAADDEDSVDVAQGDEDSDSDREGDGSVTTAETSHAGKKKQSPASSKMEGRDGELLTEKSASSPFIKRKRLFSKRSRSYNPSKVGARKNLPCPSPEGPSGWRKSFESNLFADVRVLAGTKILSFNDSRWRTDQMELGHLRTGGNWRNASIDAGLVGFSLNLIDDFPREILSILGRDLLLLKRNGSVEMITRLRHIQIDAMLPTSRYPILLQPISLGVDRRDSSETEGSGDVSIPGSSRTIQLGDQYWRQHDEKPIPFFEGSFAYVPQLHMTWIPDLKIFTSPMKMQLELDYVLRIVDLILNLMPESDQRDVELECNETLKNANSTLAYPTHRQQDALLTYVEKLVIAPIRFELELDIRPERSDSAGTDEEMEGQAVLALSSMGRSTKSSLAAGLLSWVTNVAAVFAHISPTFKFEEVSRVDKYCNADELVMEIARLYVTKIILQSYKVLFSMHLLGDPNELVDQYKTGVVDLVAMTRDEIASGGKSGFGKGVVSLTQNVFGGTFYSIGKLTGGLAELLDSITSNEMTSNEFKPKPTSVSDTPDHVGDGLAQGTVFFGKAVVHGVAGVFGNPYRGMKKGSAKAVAKGVLSGFGGLVVAPAIGALGFTAKFTEGVGATTHIFEVGIIEARCRPARIVSWGNTVGTVPLPYLKAVGIRVHVVRYQKRRPNVSLQVEKNSENNQEENMQDSYPKNAKEFRKAKAAEQKRKHPSRKILSVMRTKDKTYHLTNAAGPKLLSDDAESQVSSKFSRYAIMFEETIILRCPDLQLSDTISIHIWNNRAMKKAVTKGKPLARCSFTLGDIYSSLVSFHQEQLRQIELRLSERTETLLTVSSTSEEKRVSPLPSYMLSQMDSMRRGDDSNGPPRIENLDSTMPTPPIQEFPLMKSPSKKIVDKYSNIEAAINEEMSSIRREEEKALEYLDDSDSYWSDSDSSFMLEDEKKKGGQEDIATFAKSLDQLYGHISLSFFPVAW